MNNHGIKKLPLRSPGILFILFLVIQSAGVFGQKEDAVVLRYSTDIKYNHKRLFVKTSLEIRINDRDGEDITVFNLPYTKKNRITELKASITGIHGELIRELGRKEIKDRSLFQESTFYSDDFCKVFELKYNVFPYIIAVEYVQEFEGFCMIANWDPHYHSGIKTRNASLDLQIPRDYKVNIYTSKIKEALPVEGDGNILYHWQSSYDTLWPVQNYQPSFETSLPRVIICPLEFTYGVRGNQANWTSFGNFIFDLMKDEDILPGDEASRVQKLISGCSSKAEKIKVLYHYLQDNTRYVNVSIDVGGLMPYPAEYVAKNKFGDCKALVNYMHSMLNLAGIESVYCLVQSGSNPEGIIKEVPCPQFDHVILMVPGENDTTWLECTSNVLPAGYLGSFTQGREVLAIRKDASSFVKTPVQSLSEVASIAYFRFSFEKEGNGKAEISFLLRGNLFEYLAAMKSELNREDAAEILRKTLPFRSFTLQKWSIERQDRDDASILLKAEVTLPDQPKKYGDAIAFDLPYSAWANFEKPPDRKLPVCFSSPISTRDTLVYLIPPGYTATSSANRTIESKFGSWMIRSSTEENSVTVTCNWALYPGVISVADYPAFYSFITSVKDTERKSKVIYKPRNR